MLRRLTALAGYPSPVQVPAVLDAARHAVLFEDLQKGLGEGAEQLGLRRLEGQLVDGGAQVAEGDVDVVRVDDGVLGALLEEVERVVHEVLVDGRVLGDEEDDRLLGASARAAGLLPGAGDGAGVADDAAGVQAADVDAQLQGVGAGDAQEFPLRQLALDLAPLGGQVAAAVGVHAAGQARADLVEPLAHGAQQALGPVARAAEADDLHVVLDQLAHQADGLGQRAAAAGEGAQQGRVPEDEVLLPRRGAVAVDQLDRPAGQLRACSAGLAMVAEEQTNCGCAP